MKTVVATIVFLSFCLSTFAQSDEINISAAFAQSIELRIVGGASATFTFATISQYQNGYNSGTAPGSKIQFQVASSTNFQLDVSHTPFTSEKGDVLESRYFFYRFQNRNGVDGYGTQFSWGKYDLHSGQNSSTSGSYVMDGETKTVIEPGSEGNAGNFEDNDYNIVIGCGNSPIRAVHKLPTLLDANITPGNYTATMTLTAVPVIL